MKLEEAAEFATFIDNSCALLPSNDPGSYDIAMPVRRFSSDAHCRNDELGSPASILFDSWSLIKELAQITGLDEFFGLPIDGVRILATSSTIPCSSRQHSQRRRCLLTLCTNIKAGFR